MTDIYLASTSPRRRELLQQIGVRFTVIDIAVPEQQGLHESPQDYVTRLSQAKARAGQHNHGDKPVLGADTIVVVGQTVLEKPGSEAECVAMLQKLSGRTHQVMTAVTVLNHHGQQTSLVETTVHFATISPQQAADYWYTGEPCDKAGGYGIQGLGAVFVRHIEGSYSSVVGLPLQETSLLLREFNIPVWQV